VPWQRRHSRRRDRAVGGIAAAIVIILTGLAFALSEQSGFGVLVGAFWSRF
jgi:hypothetical protein